MASFEYFVRALLVALFVALLVVAIIVYIACKYRQQRAKPQAQVQHAYTSQGRIAQGAIYCEAGSRYRATSFKKSVYHDLVQMLVNRFEGQRKEKYQFAVLILSSETDASKIERGKIWAKKGVVDTNSAYSTHPRDIELNNFMVARPHGPYHAEKLLMDKFNKLRSKNKDCKTIVLYTWLLPCNSCAEEIAKVLGPYEGEVIVLYTSIVKDMHNEDDSKDKLRNAGIKLEKVHYDKDLKCKTM